MYERIVVGTDGSETADRAVDAAARLATASEATLTVAHAYSMRMPADRSVAFRDAPAELRWKHSPGTYAEGTVAAAVERARTAGGVGLDVCGVAEPGRPADVLLDVASRVDADAIVIGNRDMAGRVRLRPSVGRAVSRQASNDVIIVDTVGRREHRRRVVRRRLLPALVGR